MDWESTDDGREVCHLCRRKRTPEGHDPCIARTQGVLFACCGHGLSNPYVVLAAADGPQSDVEYFRREHAAPELGDQLRGDTLYGAEAVLKLCELRNARWPKARG